jgi:hypothetical protein
MHSKEVSNPVDRPGLQLRRLTPRKRPYPRSDRVRLTFISASIPSLEFLSGGKKHSTEIGPVLVSELDKPGLGQCWST